MGFHTLWSVKGGSGVTVTAAAFAVQLARTGAPTLLVDLRGDQPAALGLVAPVGPGVLDWLATSDGDADALRRLEVPVTESLSMLPMGSPDPGAGSSATAVHDGARHRAFAEALGSHRAHVVVDAGTVAEGIATDGLAWTLAQRGTSILVTRPCYLALRRASRHGRDADGVIVLSEPGRPLRAHDVTEVLQTRLVAEVPVDDAIARAVDSGMLARRRVRSLDRALSELG